MPKAQRCRNIKLKVESIGITVICRNAQCKHLVWKSSLSGHFIMSHNDFVKIYGGMWRSNRILMKDVSKAVRPAETTSPVQTRSELFGSVISSLIQSRTGRADSPERSEPSASYSLRCGPCLYGNRTPRCHYGMEKALHIKRELHHFHPSRISRYFSEIYTAYMYMYAVVEVLEYQHYCGKILHGSKVLHFYF